MRDGKWSHFINVYSKAFKIKAVIQICIDVCGTETKLYYVGTPCVNERRLDLGAVSVLFYIMTLVHKKFYELFSIFKT